ncbi:MAG: hypothetical protein WCF90_06570 [Methanomicrobiales archaeon]
MTGDDGKKEIEIAWRHTSLIVRAGIFAKAHEQGIDISDICNKTLVGILAVDYRQHYVDDTMVTRPVIIAQNAHPAEENMHTPGVHPAHSTGHTPVINADYPAASLTVRRAKLLPRSQPPHKETGDAIAPNHPDKEKGVL